MLAKFLKAVSQGRRVIDLIRISGYSLSARTLLRKFHENVRCIRSDGFNRSFNRRFETDRRFCINAEARFKLATDPYLILGDDSFFFFLLSDSYFRSLKLVC